MTLTHAQDSNRFYELINANIRHVVRQLRQAEAKLTSSEESQALHTLNYAIEFVSPTSIEPILELLYCLIPIMEQTQHRDDWIPYLKKGIELSHRFTIPQATAKLNYHLGVLYQMRAQYDLALDALSLSASIYAGLDDDGHHGVALSRTAYILRLQNKYDEAVAAVKKALALFHADDPRREQSYFVLGAVALDQGDAQAAVEHFEHSLACCERQSNQRLIAQRSGNLGTAYFEQDQFDMAIPYYQRAIGLLGLIDDPGQQAIMLMNLGNAHSERQDLSVALDLYDSAEPILRSAGDELHLTMLYVNMGIVLGKLEKWQRAEEYFLSAIERYQTLGNTKLQIGALIELGKLFVAKKEKERARVRFEEASSLLMAIENKQVYEELHATVTKQLVNLGINS